MTRKKLLTGLLIALLLALPFSLMAFVSGGGGGTTFGVSITPRTSDGAGLGTAALPWSDLFLASGAVINFNNDDITLTHSANILDLAGGALRIPLGSALAPSLLVGAAGDTTGLFSVSSGNLDVSINGTSSSRFSTNAIYILRDLATIELGAGSDLIVGREAAAIWQHGADGAAPVTQAVKGADARAGTDTDTVGGIMRLASGRSTGNAVPAVAAIQGTAMSTTSSTSAQTLIDRFIPNAFRVLTNNTATAVVNATAESNLAAGGLITYTIEVTDGTEYQVETGQALYSKTGAIAGTITEVNSQQNLSAGTLATTWAISNANPAVISINANSSLTASTGYPRITFSIQNLGNQAIAIQ